MLTLQASGHVPVVGEAGSSPETAIEIDNPTKSLVIYSEVHEAKEPQFYTFEGATGMRFRSTVNLPLEYENTDFRPVLVLIGPDLGINNSLPEYVELPAGLEAMVFEPGAAQAVYEGFTPSAFLVTTSIDMVLQHAGQYYLVIYDDASEGRYSVTIGFVESFTLEEWLLVPLNVISIHMWEGQLLASILLPIIATPTIGLVFYYLRLPSLKGASNVPVWIGAAGAFLILGSGVSIFYQMVIAVLAVSLDPQIIITTVFGLLPLLLGTSAVRYLFRPATTVSSSSLLKVFIISIVSLFVWGGYLVGPLLLMTSIIGIYLMNSKPQTSTR